MVFAIQIKPASIPVNAHPTADGTFIQEYLIKDWTDKDWQREFKYLKEAGMHYVIIGSVADADDDNSPLMTIYPTNIKGCHMKPGYHDLVDMCLRNAKDAGLKVFLGTNTRNDWFKHMANDRGWFLKRMEESNMIADELWTKYKSRYPETFCGWYWNYEIDNLNYDSEYKQDTVAKGLNIVLDHLKSKGEKMPLMLCPFMNTKFGTPLSYKKMWKYIFAQTHFTKGDIFAPQDSVGAGGTDLSNITEWYIALREAVISKPGLSMWSDTETFDSKTWNPEFLKKFITQLRLESPYVKKFITFAYSHYYSPNVVDPGYHATYMDYLKSGKIENTPPQIKNIYAKKIQNGGINVYWDKATDNIGVCCYKLYKNGKLILNEQLGRKDYDKACHALSYSYDDYTATASGKYTYSMEAYDFAGNVSKTATVTVNY